MSVLDIAKKRYSVRKYKNQPIENDKLEQILEAAIIAPTAANIQPHRLLVLNEEESLAKLRKATTSHHNAPLAIIILGDHNNVWVRDFDGKNMVDIDTSIVTTHMMLTATDLGLGSCWVTWFNPAVIRQEFNLPSNLEPVSILTLGYSADTPQSPERHAQTRKPYSETIFFNTL